MLDALNINYSVNKSPGKSLSINVPMKNSAEKGILKFYNLLNPISGFSKKYLLS